MIAVSEDRRKKQAKRDAKRKLDEARRKAKQADSGMLAGKKSYIVAGIMLVLVGLQAFGVDVPEPVWGALGALGLGALRAAHQKTKAGADSAREAVEAVSEKLDVIFN